MDLKKSIKILELEDSDISIKLVKKKYRELVKKYHPDLTEMNNKEIINEINEAYKFLINFLEDFNFPLDYLLNSISDEDKILKRFSDDWLSGKKI